MSDVFFKEKVDLSPETRAHIESIKDKAKELWELMYLSGNLCRETSLAVTKLEESVMWAVKGAVIKKMESNNV